VVVQSSDNWESNYLGKSTPIPKDSYHSSEMANQQFDGKWLVNNGFTQEGRKSAKISLLEEKPDINEKSEAASVSRSSQAVALESPGLVDSHAVVVPQRSQVNMMNNTEQEDGRESSRRVSNENFRQQATSQLSRDQKLSDKGLAFKLSGNNSIPQSAQQVPQQQVVPQSQMSPADAYAFTRQQSGQELPNNNNVFFNSETGSSSFAQSESENIRRYEERLAQNNRGNAVLQDNSQLIPSNSLMLSKPDIPATAAPIGTPGVFRDRNGVMSNGMKNKSTENGAGIVDNNNSDMDVSGRMGGGYSGGGISSSSSSVQLMVTPHVVGDAKPATPEPVFVKTSTMTTKTASLDIEIPQTGTVYFFTAPKAEHWLSIRGLSHASSQRVGDLTCVMILFAAIGFSVVAVKKIRKKRKLNHGS
jgi:hypothetical protein